MDYNLIIIVNEKVFLDSSHKSIAERIEFLDSVLSNYDIKSQKRNRYYVKDSDRMIVHVWTIDIHGL